MTLLTTAVLVAVAGAGGAVLRDLLGQWLGSIRGMNWANRIGAVVLAGLAAAVAVEAGNTTVLLVVGGGFCGGLTTFSTLVVTAAQDDTPQFVWREVILGLVLVMLVWLVTASVVA